MASILGMSVSSDSEDDVDYVPPTKEAASDSSCCEDEIVSDDELIPAESKIKKTNTTKEGKQKAVDKDVRSNFATRVDEKKHATELWESFLSDVESVTPKKSTSGNGTNVISCGVRGAEALKIDRRPISKVFEFAGETIAVNSCDSAQGKIVEPDPKEKPTVKRGIESVLGTIMNKNKKLTVLEKSKLDWCHFKKDEGLDNELKKFNRGKLGFLERQRFLERSDLRSFEKEKSLRQTLQKK